MEGRRAERRRQKMGGKRGDYLRHPLTLASCQGGGLSPLCPCLARTRPRFSSMWTRTRQAASSAHILAACLSYLPTLIPLSTSFVRIKTHNMGGKRSGCAATPRQSALKPRIPLLFIPRMHARSHPRVPAHHCEAACPY